MFHRGKLYAYEFKREAVPQPSAAFADEFGTIVYENNLEDLVSFKATRTKAALWRWRKLTLRPGSAPQLMCRREIRVSRVRERLHGHLSGSLNLCHNGDWTLKHHICLVRSCELSMEVLIVSMTHFVENDICGIF
jgi:hypothetical protein